MKRFAYSSSLSSLVRRAVFAGGLACLSWAAGAGTLLISNGSPVQILVPPSDIGSSWRAPSFDDSGWQSGTNGVGFEVTPVEYGGLVIADAAADWSATGQQGENGWVNGIYDKTADPTGTYSADKFQPFRRSTDPWGPNNFWNGGSWKWYPENPPWTMLAQMFLHPNGTNSAGLEHWSIRRWRSTVSGPVTLRFHVRKDSGCDGNGVTGKVFRNGVELFSRAIAGSDRTGFIVLIPTTISAGDYLDFAVTPVGADGDGNDGCDGSQMTAQVLAGALVEPAAVTDTFNGWGGGTQGANNWFYGFWNKTADPDGIYDPAAEFISTDPDWTFDGANWVLGPGNPPWSSIGRSEWHPDGPDPLRWVIKRWVAPADGDYHCRVQFAKQNLGCGNGTTLHVLQNGVEKGRFTVAFNDGQGIDTFVPLPGVLAGQPIEFALDPTGTDGSAQDGCDGSRLLATIYAGAEPWMPSLRPLINTDVAPQMHGVNASVYLRLPFTVDQLESVDALKLKLNWNDGYVLYLNGVLVDKKHAPTVIEGSTLADSIADWSPTGEQGFLGWYYGYYDRSLDWDDTYAPDDLTFWTPTYWDGSGWDLVGPPTWGPPWTELYQENAHPNSPNGGTVDPGNPATHEHWLCRRWVAQVDSATLKCRIKFRKTNPDCGDGVIGYIFVNGVLVYSNSIAFDDTVGRDDVVELPEVLMGYPVDIMIAPGSRDWCDGHAFSATIFEGTPSIPWNAAATDRRTAIGPTAVSTLIDLTAFKSELQTGPNVLAIQALNYAPEDPDFLLVAELQANRAPSAADDVALVWEDVATNGPAAFFLANDSDPDGDPLLLVGVTPSGVSAAGGQVQLLGETVYYTPPAGYVGWDSISYAVTDTASAPVQATVNLAVASARISSIQKDPGAGPCTVGLRAVPGLNYTLLRSTQLPAASWTPVDGPKPGAPDGTVALVDANPPPAQAFYQVAITP